MRYYTVGKAMTLLERGGFPFSLYACKPRLLTPEIVLNESFPEQRITRIFTDYEQASEYAKSLHRRSLYPKAPGLGGDAAILTFSTDINLTENAQKIQEGVEIPEYCDLTSTRIYRNGTIEYILGNVPLNNVQIIRAEFIDEDTPAVDFQHAPSKKCVMM